MVYQCDVIPKPTAIPFLPKNIREEWKMEQQKEYGNIINSIIDNQDYEIVEGILYKLKQEEMAARKGGW